MKSEHPVMSLDPNTYRQINTAKSLEYQILSTDFIIDEASMYTCKHITKSLSIETLYYKNLTKPNNWSFKP